jgi:hypothetical protein
VGQVGGGLIQDDPHSTQETVYQLWVFAGLALLPVQDAVTAGSDDSTIMNRMHPGPIFIEAQRAAVTMTFS